MTGLTLRQAKIDDAENLFAWRNTFETRQHFFDPKPIAWEEHLQWFKRTVKRKDTRLLIGEAGGRSIGVLRYDIAEGTADVSIYLVPGFSGKGLGSDLLVTGNAWIRKNLPGITKIRAHILPKNIASQKAFAKAGFREFSRVFEYTVK